MVDNDNWRKIIKLFSNCISNDIEIRVYEKSSMGKNNSGYIKRLSWKSFKIHLRVQTNTCTRCIKELFTKLRFNIWRKETKINAERANKIVS